MKTTQAYYKDGKFLFNERGWPEEPSHCSQNLPRCEMVQFANCECNDAELKFIEALTSSIESSVPFEDQSLIEKLVYSVDGITGNIPINFYHWKSLQLREGLYYINEIEVKRICKKWCGGAGCVPNRTRCKIPVGEIVARIVDSSPEPVKQETQVRPDEVLLVMSFASDAGIDSHIAVADWINEHFTRKSKQS